MVRVCQVLHGIVGGGSEQVVLNYCSRMHDIHFDLLYQYEPNPQILERFREAGINCIQIPDKVSHPLKHLWTMFKIFRNGNYDVVHSHLDWFMNSYVCFLAMLAGVKKRIAHHHQAYTVSQPSRSGCNVTPDLFRGGIAYSIKTTLCSIMRIPCKLFATHWLACGEAAAINGWGKSAVLKGKVTILPNAIDPERFKFSESTRREVRAQYGIKDDDFVIGHVGRFFPEKNHNFLLDVFLEVLKKKANAKLLLLGNGPLQEKIHQKAKSLGIEKNVFFVGLQKNPNPFYCAMDIFCLPSLREAFGIVLLEAQYNGLYCLISSSISRESAITQNVNYLPIDDIGLWAQSIVDKKSRDYSPNTLTIENDCFNIKYCTEKLEKIYQN